MKREEVAIWIQMILAIFTFLIALVSIFIPSFLLFTGFMISILLFDMAYNNYLFYHYKWVTPIYIFIGIGILLNFTLMVMHLG